MCHHAQVMILLWTRSHAHTCTNHTNIHSHDILADSLLEFLYLFPLIYSTSNSVLHFFSLLNPLLAGQQGVLTQKSRTPGSGRICRPTCVWGRWWGWANQVEAIGQLDCSQEADVASVSLA